MSATPTPEQIEAVLRHPNAYTVAQEYSGGFTTERGVEIVVGGDDIAVHLHQHIGRGGGRADHYMALSRSESAELRAALEFAERANENLERNES